MVQKYGNFNQTVPYPCFIFFIFRHITQFKSQELQNIYSGFNINIQAIVGKKDVFGKVFLDIGVQTYEMA